MNDYGNWESAGLMSIRKHKEILTEIIERLEGKKIRPLGTGLEEGINKGLNIAISIILEDMEGDKG